MCFVSTDLRQDSFGFGGPDAHVARRQLSVSVLIFACFGAASALVMLA